MGEKKPIYKKWWVWVIGVVAILVLRAIFDSGSENTISNQTPPPHVQITRVVEQPQAIFDIPALIGKNIDQMASVLGTPTDDSEPSQQQLSFGVKEWSKTFKKGNQELLITYNPRTRTIIDFFIPTTDPSRKTQDRAGLKSVGNVQDSDPKYALSYVRAIGDPLSFTGLKIVPH